MAVLQSPDMSKKEVNMFIDIHASDIETSKMFRETVREFSQKRLRPYDDGTETELGVDKTHTFPHEAWTILGDQGLLGVNAPEEFGGLNMGALAHVITTEEIHAASGSIGLSHLAHTALCTHQIVRNGSQAQKEKYLPKLISGEHVGALAMSEADAGSDVMSMKTTATKVDGGYVINGSKLWITNGARHVKNITEDKAVTADTLFMYAGTGDRKLTSFILEGGMDGFNPGYKIAKETLHGSETWELQFDNCFVPEENIVGEVNRGAHVLMSGLNYEREVLAAGALGLAQAAFNEAAKYTVQRKQFGKTLSKMPVLSARMAQYNTQLSATRALIYSYAAAMDKGVKLSNADCAKAFNSASRMAKDVTRGCQEILGGQGLTQDWRMARLVRDAQLYATGGGTEDIRDIVIARDIYSNPALDAFKAP